MMNRVFWVMVFVAMSGIFMGIMKLNKEIAVLNTKLAICTANYE